MYQIEFSHRAKKALKKLKRSGSFDINVLSIALSVLTKGDSLSTRYKDHALQGRLVGLREFHLGFDLLVKYERDESLRLITILDIGTHPDLFGG